MLAAGRLIDEMIQGLVDTHCHIHDSAYDFLVDEVLTAAAAAGVGAMVCVGTDLRSSLEAVDFAATRADCYAAVGLHPHLAVRPLAELRADFKRLEDLVRANRGNRRLVAVGECGLDYFYHQDAKIRQKQRELLSWHLVLAESANLPLIFHVRNAFDDFWPVYGNYAGRSVLHSFSDAPAQIEKATAYADLYIGLNGIMTFSRDQDQLEAARLIPEGKLVLETDAPYLTPAPLRGRINKPEYLRVILDFLSQLRGVRPDDLAVRTTENARALFGL